MKMNAIFITIIFFLSSFYRIASCQNCSTQPTSSPASQKVISSAKKNNDKNDKVSIILDKLEQAGKKICDLQANVRYELYQIIPDDKQIKLGLIRYRSANDKSNAKFMVHFHTLIHDNLKLKRKEWFCFDGHWLREIREQTRTVIDREIVAPKEKINPFKLGQGPFPLPFGQKKKEILKNFNVRFVKQKKSDPVNSWHIILTPKTKSKFKKKYRKIEFWIDKKINLPIKIVALDKHSNQTTVLFSAIKINSGIEDSKLWIAKPAGFAYQREPIEK